MSGHTITFIDNASANDLSEWQAPTHDGKELSSIQCGGTFTGTVTVWVSNKPYDETNPPDTDEKFALSPTITDLTPYYFDTQSYEQYQVQFAWGSGSCSVWGKTRNDQ